MSLSALMEKTKKSVLTDANAKVAKPAKDEEKTHENGLSLATLAGLALATHQTEKSVYWLVTTSDRGTVAVTCSEPMSMETILNWVPGAVSAIPTYEPETDESVDCSDHTERTPQECLP